MLSDAYPSVFNGYLELVLVSNVACIDIDLATLGELERILDQVNQDLLQAVHVSLQHGKRIAIASFFITSNLHCEKHVLSLCLCPEHVKHELEDFVWVVDLTHCFEDASLHLFEIKHVIDEEKHHLGLVEYHFE